MLLSWINSKIQVYFWLSISSAEHKNFFFFFKSTLTINNLKRKLNDENQMKTYLLLLYKVLKFSSFKNSLCLLVINWEENSLINMPIWLLEFWILACHNTLFIKVHLIDYFEFCNATVKTFKRFHHVNKIY